MLAGEQEVMYPSPEWKGHGSGYLSERKQKGVGKEERECEGKQIRNDIKRLKIKI